MYLSNEVEIGHRFRHHRKNNSPVRNLLTAMPSILLNKFVKTLDTYSSAVYGRPLISYLARNNKTKQKVSQCYNKKRLELLCVKYHQTPWAGRRAGPAQLSPLCVCVCVWTRSHTAHSFTVGRKPSSSSFVVDCFCPLKVLCPPRRRKMRTLVAWC